MSLKFYIRFTSGLTSGLTSGSKNFYRKNDFKIQNERHLSFKSLVKCLLECGSVPFTSLHFEINSDFCKENSCKKCSEWFLTGKDINYSQKHKEVNKTQVIVYEQHIDNLFNFKVSVFNSSPLEIIGGTTLDCKH